MSLRDCVVQGLDLNSFLHIHSPTDFYKDFFLLKWNMASKVIEGHEATFMLEINFFLGVFLINVILLNLFMNAKITKALILHNIKYDRKPKVYWPSPVISIRLKWKLSHLATIYATSHRFLIKLWKYVIDKSYLRKVP